MPHVNVKHWPGPTEQQKRQLAEAITRDVMRIFGDAEASVSVAIEEVPSSRWAREVYRPEIVAKSATLYKEPGYEV